MINCELPIVYLPATNFRWKFAYLNNFETSKKKAIEQKRIKITYPMSSELVKVGAPQMREEALI